MFKTLHISKKLHSVLIASLVGLFVLSSTYAQRQPFEFRAENPVPIEVNTMYDQGLKYLAGAQAASGQWLDGYGNEPGVVGLALMAFLAGGEDPQSGRYAENIKRCVNFIISQQNTKNGFIGRSMYNHGFAMIALGEVYGTIDNPKIGPALEAAVKLTLAAQKANTQGGWRYTPESTEADSTVTGCQIVALYAARNAGIPVPQEAFDKAAKYMKRCRTNQGGYGYVVGSQERVTLTAIGSLCLSLAKEKKDASFTETTNFLIKNLDYRDTHYPYYFEYYMSQALFQADPAQWQKWNENNIRYLGASQASDGSWPYERSRSYATACSLLSLALNYRYLPIYER